MSLVIEDVLVRNDPVGSRLPVVLDSPHSGISYPPDFVFACPLGLLRQAEDAFVDELFAAAPETGATLLCALFPRSYIDVNRAVDDIDPAILDGPWHEPARPGEKSAFGMGLIRTLCRPGVKIYDGRIPVADVMDRIERFYRPYHFQLATLMESLATEFGMVWHLNCHSMPTPRNAGVGAPDFVLGDRDGTTCDPHFLQFVKRVLEGFGYRIAVNAPYRGVELIRRYSNPKRGRHSLQLEIGRRLYMDEETLEKHSGFKLLRSHLTELVRQIGYYAEARISSQAAE